mgnify:CR=1 FL=1
MRLLAEALCAARGHRLARDCEIPGYAERLRYCGCGKRRDWPDETICATPRCERLAVQATDPNWARMLVYAERAYCCADCRAAHGHGGDVELLDDEDHAFTCAERHAAAAG